MKPLFAIVLLLTIGSVLTTLHVEPSSRHAMTQVVDEAELYDLAD